MDIQDTEDPDLLREMFDTGVFASSYQRSETIQKAGNLFIEAGRGKDADEARWDAALFSHHRRDLGQEAEGRFGPLAEFSNGFVLPDPSIFTEEVLDYYERRAGEVNNPVLRSWYADFIWERRRTHVFARIAIQAMHETYPLFLEDGERWHEAADSIVRPLRLARALRQAELVDTAKKTAYAALQDFMSAKAHPAVRYALEPIDTILEGSDVTKDETAILLQSAKLGEAFYKGEHTYHLAQSFAKRVATLQSRLGAEGESQEAQLRIGQYYEVEAEQADSGIASAIHLQEAIRHYVSVGSTQDVERLKKEVNVQWGSEPVQREFKTIHAEMEYPLEEVRTSARRLLTTGLEAALIQLGLGRLFIPAIDSMRNRSRNLAEQFPLQHLVTRVIMRGSHQVQRGDTPKKSEEASLYQQYDLEVGVMGINLHETLSVFREEGGLSLDSLLDFLRKSPFIDKEVGEILEVGIERYLAADYISAIHVLVPKLEDALRKTLGMLNGSTTSIRGDMTRAIDLEQVLRAPELVKLLGEDTIFFLKYLLVEQLGENMRNDVTHGLMRKSDCTPGAASLVLLALFRLVPYELDSGSDAGNAQPSV